MNRELDGVYFRVKRNEKYETICFSDLTKEEREHVLEGRDAGWMKSLCCHLADRLKPIGDQFGIASINAMDDERDE